MQKNPGEYVMSPEGGPHDRVVDHRILAVPPQPVGGRLSKKLRGRYCRPPDGVGIESIKLVSGEEGTQ